MREALSASMDGEDPGVDAESLRAHLDECGACSRWHAEAERVNRMLRIAPAPAHTADVTDRVLAEVRLPRRRRWRPAGRIALAVVAIVQLAIGAINLTVPLGLHIGMATSAHMDHEVAAFNLAFGVALLVVAVNTGRARAQLPLLGSFLLVVAGASVFDLASGAVGWSRLATHLPIVLGLVLVAGLARKPRAPGGPAAAAGTEPERASEAPPYAEHVDLPRDGSPPSPAAYADEYTIRRSA